MRLWAALVLSCGLIAGLALPARAEDPWADAVAQFVQGPNPPPGFDDPQRAVGAPRGSMVSAPNNGACVSLGGQGGQLTLKFNSPVVDDPANPFGLDCIVFSNAFWVGGNPQLKFQEPALIEISEDTNGNGVADDSWYLIPGSRSFPYAPFPWRSEPDGQANSAGTPDPMAGNIRNPNTFDVGSGNDNTEYTWGYAEMTPAVQPYLDNYVRPDDPLAVGLTDRSGGGDAFDIAWAADASGQPANLSQFHFLRLTSFVTRNFGVIGVASPEIDAAADVAPNVDADGDGILDDYETRVAATDPLRPESTVLPLEIPPHAGGSPAGTLLGAATHPSGTCLRLYANDPGTDGAREFNAVVDIIPVSAPSAPLPQAELVPSQCVYEIQSSIADFMSVGIQSAEVVLHYQSTDIAGLDEAALQPYSFRNGAYGQVGLTSIQANPTANQVSFRTQYPGTFLLAAPSGSGDTASATGPQGVIALQASPAEGTVADPANTISVTSGVILNETATPIVDGTLITVSSSRGQAVSADADGSTSGTQVAAVAGAIAFTIQAPQQAGTVTLSAASVQGAAYGELLYAFLPGPPASEIEWQLREPHGADPVVMDMDTERVRDQFGNIVRDGVLLTIEITGDGVLASGDADSDAPGYQARIAGGVARITVETPFEDSEFGLNVYTTQGGTPLGQGLFSPKEFVHLPIYGVLALATLCLLAGARGLRRNYSRR